MSAPALDPDVDALIQASRSRRRVKLPPREFAVASGLAGAFAAAAASALLFLPSDRELSFLRLGLLVGLYAVLSRVRWEVGTGATTPTQLVFVPMLFLLPAGVVPVAVAAGLLLGALLNPRRGRRLLERLPRLVSSAWYAVGPAVVVAAAGGPEAAWSALPVLLAALAAQFAGDLAATVTHDALAYGVSPRRHLAFMGWVYAVDTALASVGFLVAFAAADTAGGTVLILPLVGLLAYFAKERRARIDHALELSQAYRGTAFLLGDVVEADDAYTGSHSRHVVDLVLAVADELGLDARARRDAEFVALLHDVGKIRVPSEIVNKPGPLDDDEWAVMKQHTIEGERMLSGVGGLLAQVGTLVRSCHERFDGGGYPDGLAADAIPLIARIVMTCDAYSAMTTDRSYRRAMSKTDALAELLSNSGTQFDPQVVRALVRLETR